MIIDLNTSNKELLIIHSIRSCVQFVTGPLCILTKYCTLSLVVSIVIELLH